MNKSNNQSLRVANFTIVTYFALMYVLNYYRVDFVLIGVFRELLTIPFLIAQIVFLVVGIIYLNNNRWDLLTAISVVLLVISTIITIWIFIKKIV